MTKQAAAAGQHGLTREARSEPAASPFVSLLVDVGRCGFFRRGARAHMFSCVGMFRILSASLR